MMFYHHSTKKNTYFYALVLINFMIREFKNKKPKLHKTVFVAESADVIGDVEIGENSSVWFNAVIRGDCSSIKIGKRTNIQDCSVLHVCEGLDVKIGDNVTVGHAAVVHACEVGSNCLIGMNSTILNGAKIGSNCVIGANAVVTEGMVVPDNSVVLGVPGKIVKTTTKELLHFIEKNAEEYVQLKNNYMQNR